MDCRRYYGSNQNSFQTLFSFAALAFRQQNVIVLLEGSHTQSSACALSTVTDIPLIRLHGNNRPFYQCEKALQMSAGYKDYAQASLDILKTFQWQNIALVFDSKISLADFMLPSDYL